MPLFENVQPSWFLSQEILFEEIVETVKDQYYKKLKYDCCNAFHTVDISKKLLSLNKKSTAMPQYQSKKKCRNEKVILSNFPPRTSSDGILLLRQFLSF